MTYLRWVGGKSLIAKELIGKFPKSSISTYIEPFFGSGSIYFTWHNKLIENNVFYELPTKFNFSDTNKFLINAHLQIRDNFESVKKLLEIFEFEYNREYKDAYPYYREVRKTVTDESEMFNDPILAAARFIFINKTCFNGLWRVNSKGGFNVPYNRKWPIKFNYNILKESSNILKNANIYEREFDNIDNNELGEHTFVYLDPPYVPLNSTSCFTSYTAKGFSVLEDLERIVNFCKRLDQTGTKWMMSNSETPQVRTAFSNWNIETIDVHRFIKAIKNKNETREKIKEVVVTNYIF